MGILQFYMSLLNLFAQHYMRIKKNKPDSDLKKALGYNNINHHAPDLLHCTTAMFIGPITDFLKFIAEEKTKTSLLNVFILHLSDATGTR